MPKRVKEVNWEVVFEWSLGAKHDSCRIQKLGFKHRKSFGSASRYAISMKNRFCTVGDIPLNKCKIIYVGLSNTLGKYEDCKSYQTSKDNLKQDLSLIKKSDDKKKRTTNYVVRS